MEEKRKSARIKANVVVSFKLKASRLAGGSRIKDISATGMCIPSKYHFPVDSILEVELRSDEFKEPIKVLARVVRIVKQDNSKDPFEVGLIFLEFPPSQQSVLHDCVRRSIAQGGSQDITWLK